MNLLRVRTGEWVAAAAGVLLFASLFVTWYQAEGVVAPAGATTFAPLHGVGTGWQAFAVADVLLTVLAVSGPALLAAQATRRSPALPAALSIVAILAGTAATVIVVVHLLARPDGADLGAGAAMGLAGALCLLAGGWWSMATEEVRGVPAPDVEARPAPPAA
jgi:hypothetical protein